MAEDTDDRTQAPTPRRRQEARQEGNVARSGDLSAALVLLGLLSALRYLGPGMLESWRQVALLVLAPEGLSPASGAEMSQTLRHAGMQVVTGTLPILLAAAALTIVVNLGQVGFLFVPGKLALRPEALDPAKGFARIFGSGKTYVGLLMNLAKLAAAGVVGWLAIEAQLPRILSLPQMDFVPAVAASAAVVFDVGLKIALALLVLAVLDYGYQRWSHEQQLKMTLQQVRDELRRTEGDPQLKARRRQMAQRPAPPPLERAIRSAQVVVIDPNRFAVALSYDAATGSPAKVSARGAGHVALRIADIASAAGVPIVERPALGRTLHDSVEVGAEIPEDAYTAVADLLAFASALGAGGEWPQMNTDAHRFSRETATA